jgi:hypothetical protein
MSMIRFLIWLQVVAHFTVKYQQYVETFKRNKSLKTSSCITVNKFPFFYCIFSVYTICRKKTLYFIFACILPVSCLVYFSVQNMEAACSSEMPVEYMDYIALPLRIQCLSVQSVQCSNGIILL